MADADDPIYWWRLAVRTSIIAGIGFCAAGAAVFAGFELLNWYLHGWLLPWGAFRLSSFLNGFVFAALFLPLVGFIVAGIAYLILSLMIRRFILSAVVMAILLTSAIALAAGIIALLSVGDRYGHGIGYGALITAVVQVRLLVVLFRCLRGIRFAEARSQQGFAPDMTPRNLRPADIAPVSVLPLSSKNLR